MPREQQQATRQATVTTVTKAATVARVLRFETGLWEKLCQEAEEDGGRTVASLIRKILSEHYKEAANGR